MEFRVEVEIISRAGSRSGDGLKLRSEARLLEGLGSELVLKGMVLVGVAVEFELEAVGSVLKAISGFDSRQGTETSNSFSGSELGLGLGVTFLHILRGGLGDECLSTTM